MRQATTYATRVAAEAARFSYTWAGTAALRNGSILQRCFRDIHAGTQHVSLDNNTLTAYTQALLADR
jgi:indole-3-acetate monooxygenase